MVVLSAHLDEIRRRLIFTRELTEEGRNSVAHIHEFHVSGWRICLTTHCLHGPHQVAEKSTKSGRLAAAAVHSIAYREYETVWLAGSIESDFPLLHRVYRAAQQAMVVSVRACVLTTRRPAGEGAQCRRRQARSDPAHCREGAAAWVDSIAGVEGERQATDRSTLSQRYLIANRMSGQIAVTGKQTPDSMRRAQTDARAGADSHPKHTCILW